MQQSEILRATIEGNKTAIAKLTGEIAKLTRQMATNKPGSTGWVDTRGYPEKITALQSQIANLEQGIANASHRLPVVEQSEKIAATIDAEQAAKAAQAEAQAVQARDQAMRQAALDQWIASGGAQADFAASWPQIHQQIATQAATQAGAAALASHQRGDPMLVAAQDALKRRYGG